MFHRLFLLCLLGLLAAGCQTSSRQMLSTLPPPTFDAPRMALPAAVAPPVAIAPAGQGAKPAFVQANTPKGWQPAASARKWQWIVIHHSATSNGGAKAFDKMHRDKGWDELGYHFVIGNGSETGDGVVEIGTRWPKQKYGAHCKTPDNQYNDYGIGICLVGNFDDSRPTAAQMKSLAKLTGYLMKTYRIPANHVIGHGDAKPTDCPGHNMSIPLVRKMAAQAMAGG